MTQIKWLRTKEETKLHIQFSMEKIICTFRMLLLLIRIGESCAMFAAFRLINVYIFAHYHQRAANSACRIAKPNHATLFLFIRAGELIILGQWSLWTADKQVNDLVYIIYSYMYNFVKFHSLVRFSGSVNRNGFACKYRGQCWGPKKTGFHLRTAIWEPHYTFGRIIFTTD